MSRKKQALSRRISRSMTSATLATAIGTGKVSYNIGLGVFDGLKALSKNVKQGFNEAKKAQLS